jgi:hypothetical protein
MTALRSIVLAYCLLLAFPSAAGTEKEGYSMREGLFFTFLNGGHVGFDTPEKAIALHNHCENGGFVFAYREHAKYRCKVELWKNEAGQMGAFGVIEIVGAPPDLNDDMKYGLFSTKPTRKTKWQVRSLSQDEVVALTAIVTRPGNQRGNLVKHLRFSKAFAVHKTEGTHTTFLVPGRWIRTEYYEAQRHHVFVGSRGIYRYQGQIVDKPTQYYDVDGDSTPEIETDETCDGWCIKLWNVAATAKSIAHFGGH